MTMTIRGAVQRQIGAASVLEQLTIDDPRGSDRDSSDFENIGEAIEAADSGRAVNGS